MINRNIFYIVASSIILFLIFLYNVYDNREIKSKPIYRNIDSSISNQIKKENYTLPKIKLEVPSDDERIYPEESKEFVSDFDGKITSISSNEEREYKKLFCHDSYLSFLKEKSEEGYRVYDIRKDIPGHISFFFFWIKCDKNSKILEIATAVHETVHKLTDDFDAYPQINGTMLKRIPETEKMMPIYKIRSKIRPYVADMIYETYLTKKSNTTDSASDMTLFFDEFNAFTYDVYVVSQLSKKNLNYSARDGLPMFMVAFIEYIKHVKKFEPNTWKLLNQENSKNLIQTLWNQAVMVFNIACKYPHGLDDIKAIKYLQNRNNVMILKDILNESPSISTETCK